MTINSAHYSIVVFIPSTHLKQVKNAMFTAGAGKIGSYQDCCWQVEGQGQFRPLLGNKAFIGDTNKLSTVNEYRVEMICEEKLLPLVITALIESHPYETPAFHYYRVETRILKT